MATTTAFMRKTKRINLQTVTQYLYVFILLVAIAVVIFVVFQPITVLPRIALSPGFALIDQSGAQLTNEDLRGHVVLYNFTYTNCDGDCADTTTYMAAVQAEVAKMNTGDIPVDLVTISVDPNDTPDILQAYAQSVNADPAVWHFLTGTESRIRWVVGGGFSTYYKVLDNGAFKLAPSFMLVDGAGILRAEYRSHVPAFDIVIRDIGLLVDEAQNKDGPSKYAYEAAHLFLCYPR